MTILGTVILLIVITGVFFWILNSRKSKVDLTDEYLLWILFTVTLSLLPLLFAWLNDYLDIKKLEPNIMEILSKGELFIIVAAIGLDSAGRLIGRESKQKKLKIIVFCGLFALVVTSSWLYARVAGGVNAERAASTSIALFFLVVSTSGASFLLLES